MRAEEKRAGVYERRLSARVLLRPHATPRRLNARDVKGSD